MFKEAHTIADKNNSFSPDLPGFQIAWDSTSLGALKTCPRKYFYSIIRGLQPKSKPLPLIYGIHYHAALEYYDHRAAEGMEHEEAVRVTVRYCLRLEGKLYEDDEGEDPYRYMPRETDCTKRTRENLTRSIVWYLEQYRNDPAKTVIMKNGKPAVELTFKMEIPMTSPDGSPMLLCGHMDRVVEFAGATYVMDHKTTGAAFGDRFWNGFYPNNQVSLYTLASTVVLGEDTRGVIISACQLLVNSCRFARRQIHITQSQTQEWLTEAIQWIEIAQTFAEQEYWPMNETSCGNYNGCEFRKVCSADKGLREMHLRSGFTERVWDPSKAR